MQRDFMSEEQRELSLELMEGMETPELAAGWHQVALADCNSSNRQGSLASLCFDPFQELLWAGTDDGRIVALHRENHMQGLELVKHVVFPAHSTPLRVRPKKAVTAAAAAAAPGAGQPQHRDPAHCRLLSLMPLSNAVFSVSPSAARLHSRGGVQLCSLLPHAMLAAAATELHVSQSAALEQQQSQFRCAAACGLNPAAPLVLLALGGSAKPVLGALDMATNQVVRAVYAAEDGGPALSALLAPLDAESRAVLVCGNSSGQVELRDPRSLQPISSAASSLAHPAGVSGLTLRGDLLVTWGMSSRAGHTSPDSLLKLYDLRMLRAGVAGSSSGWQLSQTRAIVFRPSAGGKAEQGPVAAHFLPNLSSSLAVLGAGGALQVLEAHSGTSSVWLQVQSAHGLPAPQQTAWQASCLAVSSAGRALAVGDSDGHLHVFAHVRAGQAEVDGFNEYSEPMERPVYGIGPSLQAMGDQPHVHMPRAPPCSVPELTFEHTSSMALPEWPQPDLAGPILSTWDGFGGSLAPALPLPPIDPSLVPGLTWVDFIGSSLTPGADFMPNHLPSLSKFCAQNDLSSHMRSKNKATRSFIQLLTSPQRRQMQVRREYARVNIKVPKFGLSEFDFSKYNQTSLCGLSNLLPNSYCNAALQLLYWTPGLRHAMLQHPGTLCPRDPCLSCELGFLFHNMDLARGATVEPRNFLRVLKQLPEASALGLLDPVQPSSELMLAVKVQDLLRFLLHQLRLEAVPPAPDLIPAAPHISHQAPRGPGRNKPQQQAPPAAQQGRADTNLAVGLEFGAVMEVRRECFGGNHAAVETAQELHFKLQYSDGEEASRAHHKGEEGVPEFCGVLKHSLSTRTPERRVWCPSCNKYQLSAQSRSLQSLPSNLLLLGNVDSDAQLGLWRTRMPPLQPLPESSQPAKAASSVPSPADSVQQGLPPGFKHITPPSSTATEHTQADNHSWLHTDKLEKPDKRSWLPMFVKMTLSDSAAPFPTGEAPAGPACPRKLGVTRYRGPLPGHPNWHQTWRVPQGQTALYALTGIVAHVADQNEDNAALGGSVQGEHLVLHTASMQSLPLPCPLPQPSREEEVSWGTELFQELRRWYLVNDFVICNSTGVEAASFHYHWKQPCILKYTRIFVTPPLPGPAVPLSPTSKGHGWRAIPPAVLYTPTERATSSRAPNGRAGKDKQAPSAYRLLSPSRSGDRVGRGSLVAIDCEFVVVQLEEKDEKVDGKVSMVTPQRMQLARVSLVRGQGPQMGVPFLDQYIVPTEPVVDHLTEFSGLRPGDLDPAVSPYPLVTLKQAFVRLQALADQGAVFVGHGLKKDFQMINMVVPADQIVDTVLLFYLPAKRRKLGLKYLAAHVLGLEVQRGTHDSIEDARTALALFQRYQAMRRQGSEHLEQELNRLYEVGAASGFKV
eukprot:g60396.t1